MRRIIKSLLRILFAVVVLGAVGVGILYHLSTRAPEGYHPEELTEEQRNVAANELETQKLPRLANLAQDAHRKAMLERNAARQGQPTTAPAVEPLQITFTQDELNAFLGKWSDQYKSRYESYFSQPYIRLADGKLILMAKAQEYDKVLSLHFAPRIDEQGMLRCEMTSVRIGSLPLPDKLFVKQRQRLEAALRQRLPAWQNGAKVDAGGASNSNATAATMGKLLLQMMENKPGPAVLFLPLDTKKTVPVRLTELVIHEGEMRITVRPLEAGEREALMGALGPVVPPVPGTASAGLR